MKAIQERFIVRGGAGVYPFLADKPEMVDILLGLADEVVSLFGQIELTLGFIEDVETAETTLCVYIPTPFTPGETHQKMKGLEHSWWARQPSKVQRCLLTQPIFK